MYEWTFWTIYVLDNVTVLDLSMQWFQNWYVFCVSLTRLLRVFAICCAYLSAGREELFNVRVCLVTFSGLGKSTLMPPFFIDVPYKHFTLTHLQAPSGALYRPTSSILLSTQIVLSLTHYVSPYILFLHHPRLSPDVPSVSPPPTCGKTPVDSWQGFLFNPWCGIGGYVAAGT